MLRKKAQLTYIACINVVYWVLKGFAFKLVTGRKRAALKNKTSIALLLYGILISLMKTVQQKVAF